VITWLIWLSLAVALAAVVASLVFVVLRGLELWRRVKAAGGAFSDGLGRVTTSTEVLAAQADSMGGATEKLDASLSRLAVSRARLRVLQQAWSEVSDPLGRVTDYVPREKEA
jgi:hypothetical protein